MLYVIDQDGLSIVPIKKNDVVTVKKTTNGYKYYVRKERKKPGPGDIIFDWLGTYDTTKETAEAVRRLAEARLCEYSSTFKMPRNGFMGENY